MKITKSNFLAFFLVCNSLMVNASQVDTLRVYSKSMSKTISNVVILPDSYDSSKENFPVLYLLHGAGGNYKNWITQVPKLKKEVDIYNFIIVCPDGGVTSWYFDSPVDKTMQYETYISQELVASIDKTYKTVTKKKARAITGLSMGGHGAFYLAFKHQDIWGAAGSMSGGLDIRPFPTNWDLSKRLGDYALYKDNWENNTIINMVHLLKSNQLKLTFDCGTSDFFYKPNKRLHEKLLERNIPHSYTERPGKHNWGYWANSIQYQLMFFNNFFKS